MKIRLRKVEKKDLRLMGLVLVITSLCLMVGFSAGYKYGTGGSVLDLWSHHKSIAPPPMAPTTSLATTSSILSSQPKQTYREGYNCLDFAWDAMRALQWKGQPAAIARLGYSDGTSHALLLIPTADKGYQFVEPQDNTVVYPEVGMKYGGKTVTDVTVLELTWTPLQTFEPNPLFGVGG